MSGPGTRGGFTDTSVRELLREFRPLAYAYVPYDFAEARRRRVVPFAPLVSRGVYTVPLRHRSPLIITGDCRSDYIKVQVSLMRAKMHIAHCDGFRLLISRAWPTRLSSDRLLNMYVFRPCIDRAQRKSRNWLNQIWITFRGISAENRARLMHRAPPRLALLRLRKGVNLRRKFAIINSAIGAQLPN